MTDQKTLISLFDLTGRWASPYRLAGWNVIQVDIQAGLDIFTWNHLAVRRVDGVIAAPPCTDFSQAGSRHWKTKDADGRTQFSVDLLERMLKIIDELDYIHGLDFWVFENPIGRLRRMLVGDSRPGEPRVYVPLALRPFTDEKPYSFNPCDFAGRADDVEAESVTKKTLLWGRFNRDLKTDPREPIFYTTSTGKRLPPMWGKTGGSSQRTKNLRSATPLGFARSFYEANR
jgi:hypothetical protein